MLLIRIERATPRDVPAVEALLAAADLPLDGAARALTLGVVARDDADVVAAAAIERFGAAGLLRSVVVSRDRRGTGLGRRIVGEAEALARAEGIRELFLLTETAADCSRASAMSPWPGRLPRRRSASRSSSRRSVETPGPRSAGS
jgi:amino-acid N-acetyltransferase